MKIIRKAYLFAHRKYGTQKYGDRPYISHPMQICKIIRFLLPLDYNLQAAAILYGIFVLTQTTYAEVIQEFGEDVALLIREIHDPAKTLSHRGTILKIAEELCSAINLQKWYE